MPNCLVSNISKEVGGSHPSTREKENLTTYAFRSMVVKWRRVEGRAPSPTVHLLAFGNFSVIKKEEVERKVVSLFL